MNTILKLGIRLFLFCMIAAIALAITNEVTKGPIAEHAMASKLAALNTVMPGYEYEEEQLENPENYELDQLYVAKDSSGNIVGYALLASPQGYGGEIPVTFGVSADGYVTQVYVGSLQETAGLGSKVGEPAFKEQFIGIAADDDTLYNDVSTISGATISSSAFMRAAEDVVKYAEYVLKIVPAPGDKDKILAEYYAANGGGEGEQTPEVTTKAYSFPVKGFDAFNVDIEIDSNGKIVSVSVPEHNETAGYGADLIADKAVFDALAGQDAATAQIEVRSGATLTSNAINEALSKAAAELAGGAKKYSVTGFAPFTVEIELDDAGKIVSVAVPSHEETPGLGADLIADAAVFDALVGKDIASAGIDVRAGVTLTSNAINDALAQAAKEFAGGGAAPVIPGDPYTVKGMNKFTMYVELDGDKIASVTVPEHNETPGLGADLLTEEALSKLAGQPIAEAKVDVVSGVTLTSNAINNALNMAALANGFQPAASVAEPAAEEPAPAEAPASADTKTFEVTGFQPFKVEVGVDADGKIVSVTVPENGETPGFGADLIADAAVFEALVGKDVKDAQIEVKSGATLTSNAINDALAQAAAAFGGAAEASAEPAKAEAPAAADTKTFEVTGFQPFKVEVGVDADGKIVSVTVPENGETPGFGADLIADAAVFEALVGKDVKDAQIEIKSGATLTSNAINDALTQAAAAFGGAVEETKAEPAEAEKAETPAAADTKTFEVTGFQPFKVEVGVDADGKIVSVTVPENGETPGFGADLIADTAVFEALVGKDVKDAQIEIKSGATLTSNAINDALAQAAAAFGGAAEAPAEPEKAEPVEAEKAEAPAAADTKTFEVTGFQPFKVEVGVDADGRIVSVTVPENGETPGFGADLIADAAVFEALVGKDVKDAQIEIKSGATLTSNAINDALTQAAAAFGGAAEAPAEPENAEAPAEETMTEPAEAEKAETPAAADTKTFEVTGFQPFKVEVGVDADGKIVSVTVPENGETPGFGADLIADAAVFEALVGKDVKDAQIEIKSGATLTSNAINDALTQAAAAFGGAVEEPKAEPAEAAPAEETKAESAEAEKAEAPAAADTKTFEVIGFQPFKVEVGVDADGKIVSVTVPENGETPGFGADLIADAAVFEALVGKDVKDAQIEIKSGATLTSNAINDALTQAAAAFGGAAEETKAEPAEAPAEEAKKEPAEAEKAEAPATADTKTFEVTGFQPFKVEVGVDADGKVVSVTVPENGETPGFGADLIADTAVFEALVGKDVKDAQIEIKSGATLTSNAINDALTQAAAAFGGATEEPKAEPAEAPAEETKKEDAAAPAEETKAEPAEAEKAEAPVAVDTKVFQVTGFGRFKVEIGVDAEGKIASVSIPVHGETPGYGEDLIADAAVFEALIGKDLKDAQIEVRAGATMTSNAINDALAQAAAAFAAEEKKEETAEAEKAEAPAETEIKTFEVTGFQPFKVEISLDADGKITGISVPENGETPGFGADLIADTAVFEALIGQSIKDAQIEVRSGATLTSNAINDALKQASEEVGK